MRRFVNVLLKISRTGIQCGSPPGRNPEEEPIHYPPWEVLNYYFRKWQKNGVFDAILAFLVEKEHLLKGHSGQAYPAAVDSQTGPPGGVKKGSLISLDTGIDGNKKINGRKRQ